MSSSDLPKLLPKVGHIYRKQSIYLKNQRFLEKFDLLVLIFLTEKRIKKILLIFEFKSTNFAILEEVVHNFGRSNDDMI